MLRELNLRQTDGPAIYGLPKYSVSKPVTKGCDVIRRQFQPFSPAQITWQFHLDVRIHPLILSSSSRCRMKRFIDTGIRKLLSNCLECSVYLQKSVYELWIELQATLKQHDVYGCSVGNGFFI